MLLPILAGVIGLLTGCMYAAVVNRFLAGTREDAHAGALTGSRYRPHSGCRACRARRHGRYALPVLGYLLARGRCPACGTSLPSANLLLPVASCLWAVAAAVQVLPVAAPGSGIGSGVATALGPLPGFSAEMGTALAQWLGLMAVGAILLMASAIDMECYLLPDVLTLPGAVFAFIVSVLPMGMAPEQALLGSVTGAGLLWLMQRAYRLLGTEGVGTGDVKLMLMLGALSGLAGLPVLFTVAAVSALLFHACASLARLLHLAAAARPVRRMIPFGPFLSLGGMVQVLWGERLAAWLS
ncbi:prepilin peptidase [Desulfovibrio psychrotolerans]|uniref:Prepilin leader peptidase/N-methyltransferase n=1 Tax=Desulfovibrio psychrotolerans TaxID=415242 RepID=A0A7J0BWW6_9BACT|nr:A24 family peptidase [Desulfovibrio psychrotolerans]GFM38210.1 type 4 prepilin-like proteins leader peptide-processing enzyme [Desulfovibrio psychrotolerans]